MKMHHTRHALSNHPTARDLTPALVEVHKGEESAAMLREICEAHWKGATELDICALVRKAEALLAKVGG